MDTLLSQLKGQGSPFASHSQAHVEKLLDTIHLLSQATVIVAQQLQRPTSPSPTPTKPLPSPTPTKLKQPTSQPKTTTPQSTAPLPKPTPPTPPPSLPSHKKEKKTTTTTHPQLPLQWVPRAPDYYNAPTTTTLTRYNTPIVTNNLPPAPPNITSNPPPATTTTNTKENAWDRLGASLSSPTPTPSPATLEPISAQDPSPTPLPIPTTLEPTSAPDPPTSNPLPTPLPITLGQPNPVPTLPKEADQEEHDRIVAKKLKQSKREAIRKAKRMDKLDREAPPPTETTPAPANDIINFPHRYTQCPRLPDCPSHRGHFYNVFLPAFRSRNSPTPDPLLSATTGPGVLTSDGV